MKQLRFSSFFRDWLHSLRITMVISTRWFFTGFNMFEPQVMMHVYLIQLVTKKLAESVESPSLLRCWNSTHVLLVIGFWDPRIWIISSRNTFKKKTSSGYLPFANTARFQCSWYIILYYVMLYYIILYHILLDYVISYYVILYYIYYIILNFAVYTHRMYPLL